MIATVHAIRSTREDSDFAPCPPPSRWWAIALFAVLTIGYSAVGAVLVLRYNVFDGDGLSRVANAGFVTMSRDPHLSAIGFVWNPLPSLIEIPMMPLTRWWPELKTYGLAGTLQSAMFMAASAVMIRRIALDRAVGTPWRWTAVGCFALHPLVILNAAFGLSESATGFCMLWCVRYLLRWADRRQTGDLAWAGLALGVGYLARYEVMPTVCGVAAMVAAIAWCRSVSPFRRPSAISNAVLVAFPATVAFIAWAVTGWIVSGDLFATISSMYGNASQVATAHERSGETSFSTGNWQLIAALVLAMQPLAGIAIAAAAVVAVREKRIAPIVPVVTFGSTLAFVVWGQFSGSTFNLFRYYMPAIPMVIVIALTFWIPTAGPSHWWRPDTTRFGTLLLSVSLLVGIPVTTTSLFRTDIGIRQQMRGVTSLFDDDSGSDPEKYRRVGRDDRVLAAYLDRLDLPDGSILMDTFTCWLVWLASEHPKQFIVTSDYDFTYALNRPWDYGVQYMVINNPGAYSTNAIEVRYPSMWADGAGIGQLVYSANDSVGLNRWRVYRIAKPPDPGDSAQLAKPGG